MTVIAGSADRAFTGRLQVLNPLRRRARQAAAAHVPALLVVAAAFLIWNVMAVGDQVTFHNTSRDVGIYGQVLWNTAVGRPFETTSMISNLNHLSEHVAPVLLPLSLPFWLVPDPSWLMVLQQVALAASGIPVYLLARRLLPGQVPALLVLVSYFAAPAMSELVGQKFHPVALATVPLSFGLYFALTSRVRLGATLAAATLLFDETSALALFGVGLVLLLGRRVRPGLALCGLATAWLALVTLVVLPANSLPQTLRQVEGNRVLYKFRDLQAGPSAALQLLGERAPDIARWWLLPNGGLGLLAPQTAIAALPTATVLAFNYDPDDLHSHRPAPALPLLWLATVQGLALLRGGWRLRAGLGLLAVGTVLAYLSSSRLPGGGQYEPSQLEWTDHTATLARAVAAVPPRRSVGATSDAAVHLVARQYLYFFPVQYSEFLWPPPRRLEWWVVDASKKAVREDLRKHDGSPLLADPPYQLWSPGADVLVAADDLPAPGSATGATFGDTLELVGTTMLQDGDATLVRLRWRLLAATKRDLVRRLDVLGPDGAVLTSDQGPEIRSYFATSDWPAGQVLDEDVPLAAASSRWQGQVRLSWSDAKGGRPLPLSDGSAALTLALR